MHSPAAHHRAAVAPSRPTSGAVVWIGPASTLVARTLPDADVTVREVAWRPGWDEAPATVLAGVIDQIGESERVLVLGSDDDRLVFERAYVAIQQRPERLLDGDWAPEPTLDELVARVRSVVAR